MPGPHPDWRVVLQIDAPGRRECHRFAEIPVIDPAHIAICTDEPAAAPQAERLYRRLLSMLSGLMPQGSSPDFCDGPRLLSCMARREPTCQSVLVVLTGVTRISQWLTDLMGDWQSKRPLRSRVLPILPAGALPGTVLPAPLDRLIALFATGAVELLAPDVLRAAGIGGMDHRLFVSYIRDDAQDLAEQLHDAFSHAGFEVFLDRFSGTPGRPFPRVLAEELADKGLVLVVESVHLGASRWVLAEVAFAKALRLGLLALAMPGAPSLWTIPGGDRHRPARGEWSSGMGRSSRLTDEGCQAAVDFVRLRYARQILYRQLYLENLLHRALARRGLKAAALGGGAFRVAGGRDYVLQLSSRPPRLGELRRAAEAARPLRAHPVVVGAHRHLPPADGSDLDWTAGALGASLRSEGRLPQMAAALAAGKVPP
jgi:hypothetical protein